MRTYSLNMDWHPLPATLAPATSTILKALRAWEGTRYRSGQRLRGVEADCIGFGCGAIDDVDGRPRAQSPSLPPDTALHSPESAKNAVAAIRRLYSPAKRVISFDGVLKAQPLDILIVSSGGGGPGHMMLIGPERNTIWHCIQGSGVNQTGWSLLTGYENVFALYRLGDRERWLLP